jgi:magnesium transporter
MKQDLIQYEKALGTAHSNYLAKIHIEITQVSNQGNRIVTQMSMIASVLFPMNVVTGMWGMNVHVPGQLGDEVGYVWFFSLLGAMLFISFSITMYIHKTFSKSLWNGFK